MKVYIAMSLHKFHIWEKSFSQDIDQLLSTSQIAGFLNQLFLQSLLIKQPHFLHVYTNCQKLKVY